MSNYSKITDYAAKDLLLSGDAAKAIKGTEVGAEFDAIATMSATKVDSGGALGTPSSGTLTNCTGLPVSTGVSGLGTGVATALAVNVGSAGAAVINGGVLGTPSSGTLTNCSGLPASALVASTTQAVGFGSIELGHASDTTITRTGAGAIAVEGVAVLLSGGALGTPSSGNLGSCTDYPSSALAGVPLTAAATGFTATGGTTPKTLTVDDDLTTSNAARRNADNTLSGTQTMSGKSIIEANASVAAHATTMNPWLGGNYVTLTGGAVTFTAMADAPQAGAEVELYMNAAHVFTDGAVFEVDGNANYTAAIGDRVLLRAKSTTVFTVHPRKADGTAVVVSASGVGDHEVVVHTGNGHGSTNTAVRRFTTTLTNVGTAITYADSAANGASFTINETGLYALHYTDVNTAGVAVVGASLNSAQLTTGLNSINVANRLMTFTQASSLNATVSRVVSLTAGDVVRPHDNATNNGTDNNNFFSIRKVGTV